MPTTPSHRALLALVLLVGLAAAQPALAHAQLLSTVPPADAVLAAAPASAELRFNEPVSVLVVSLIGPDGGSTDLTAVANSGETVSVPLPADLTRGSHVLSWRVVSVDAHAIGGSLVFSLGTATDTVAIVPQSDATVAALLWAMRALLLAALFIGVGGAVFGLIAPLPKGLLRPLGGIAGLGALAAIVSLGLSGADALGLPLVGVLEARSWATAMGTSFFFTVLALLGAFAFALCALRGWMPKPAALLAWLLGAAALALSGHAGAAEPQWLTRPAVVLHAAALLFWLGALWPLLVKLRANDPGTTTALQRFSRAIPFAILPLLVSGGVLAMVQMGPPGPHWLSPYGIILAIKLGLVAALLLLALWNRLGLTKPALSGAAGARRRLALSVRAEIVVVLLVLALVGGWRLTPPPRALAQAEEARIAAEAERTAAPAFVHLMDAAVMANLTVTPGRAGPVTLDIALTDFAGAPLAAEAVLVEFAAPERGIEPLRFTADSDGETWRVAPATIPVPGAWHVTLEVRLSRFSLARLSEIFALE